MPVCGGASLRDAHGDKSGEQVLFHGTLSVKVCGARSLKRLGLRKALPDPYVKGYLGKGTLLKTSEVQNSTEPEWNETFVVPFANFDSRIVFSVKHAGKAIGEVVVPLERIVEEKDIDEWLRLGTEHVHRDAGELHLVIKFQPADEFAGKGLEVPNVYFPMRKGCKVHMFQDAIVYPGQLPSADLMNGNVYSNGSCWEELYSCLQQAEKFIYCTGWSFWVHTHLVRKPLEEGSHLGNLLAKKADEGLTVLMLVWDDQTSGNMLFGKEGMMGTKDEETREFFEKTKVVARLVARATDAKTKVIKRAFSSSVYTHHQKSVIFDQLDEASGERKVAAFVGGLDLTTGRYDTPDHTLFSTLDTDEHKDDFYSNCITGVTENGPREPWHDIHGHIEGPCAIDVMKNFEERWMKQAPEDIGRLLKLENLGLPTGDDARVNSPEDQESWNVQYFRSIDERSAVFSINPKEHPELFFSKKGRTIDMSIQMAYAHYIRNAEKFIYIENQYFLGSSNEWRKSMFSDSLSNMDGATHIIPMEIALKICQKIRAGEHFCAYILIPLFPEGLPESGAVQEILCWQRNTAELMYRTIHDELKRNEAKHPGKQATDFLTFFALGNREFPPEDKVSDPIARAGRHMIYVHSKMIIVDDSVILMGSANINQRSMDGGRDTEMAFGAHQPAYTVQSSGGDLPKGQVHGFRMSLFAEHLGFKFEPWMTDPSTQEAMRAARAAAEANFEVYASENLDIMPGHLMLYPYSIDSSSGTLFANPLHTTFPGTEAKVVGREGMFMPDSATM